MKPAIELENVSLLRGGSPVLEEVHLSIEQGQVLALLGPSGCGKTSLSRVILGLDAPTKGSVRLAGRVASRDGRILTPPETRGLSVVFQDLALWPHLTVQGNLTFGLEARAVPPDQMRQRISETLALVGLPDAAHRHPGELSGGERQRVAIARALVLDPDAVVLDEPFSNLDVVTKQDLLTMMARLLSERSCAALYVTHDPREAAALTEHLAVMQSGRIVQTGTLDQLRRAPATPFVSTLLTFV